MLALSGAALGTVSAAAVSACGAAAGEGEGVSDEEDAELLNEALTAQLAVLAATRQAQQIRPPEDVLLALALLEKARQRSTTALEAQVEDLGGTPTDEPAPQAAQAESAVEGLARQLEDAIAAQLDVVGELSPERRAPVHRAITEDAAVLAVLRSTLGEPVAPDAFVLGAEAS